MRISDGQINELKTLLKELYGIELTGEQAQDAGMAILRFVLTKSQQQLSVNNIIGEDDE